MKSDQGVELLRTTIGNPIVRNMLAYFNRHCPQCSENRLDVALELYAGTRREACSRCRLAGLSVSPVLTVGARSFGISEQELKQTLANPYWRKGLISVVKGIATFGIKRPFVPGAPFQVVWDVTYACNLRCKHCYASAGKPLEDELSTYEALGLVDRLADMGVPILAFSGGEPLTRPDILRLVRRARDRGMYPALATNGTLITPSKAREMKEAGVEYLQISLDGADASSHDGLRGIPGCFDRTLDGIKNAVAENFFVNISTTVTRQNHGQVEDIIDMCDELGVNWFMAYNFIPAGRGKDIVDIDLTPQMREDLLKLLYEKGKTSKCQVLSTAPQFARVALQECTGGSVMVPTHFYNQVVEGKLFGLTEFIGGCGAARFYMAIRADGRIDPCVFFQRTIGNVRTHDLNDIWTNDPLFLQLRDKDLLEGNCGHCDYRYHCGGCRARANGYFDDPLAPDPGCIRNIDLYEGLITGAGPAPIDEAPMVRERATNDTVSEHVLVPRQITGPRI